MLEKEKVCRNRDDFFETLDISRTRREDEV
jgi:hypothetical protein